MTTKITLLVDNQAQDGLKHEHGLSILIEHKGKRILFDNGQSDVLFLNAEKLQIPLKNIDIIILSHGHFDHGGNLERLLYNNPYALFYAHPECQQTRYSLHPNKPVRTISLPQNAINALENFPEKQKKFITKPTKVMPDIWLTGQILRISEFEDTGGPFFLDTGGKQADQLNDDMSLWIESEDSLNVICGCCHSGIINTLKHIKKQNSNKKIKTILGGLHLVNANQTRINNTIEYLNKQNIDTIYPAHCTGGEAMQQLTDRFNNKIEIAKAGLIITL